MERPPVPVRHKDHMMGCAAIYAEVAANNQEVKQLAKAQGWKTRQNVVAGVDGFVIIPVLWGADRQGTAFKKARALQARQQYLEVLILVEHCGKRPQTAKR